MHSHIEAFYRPTSLEEAVRLLKNPDQKAIVVAGATEVGLRVRSAVKALVDLSGLGLDNVWTTEQGLHLGAMVRATRLVRDASIGAFTGHALPESAFAIASEPIRNLTSVGGNVIHLTSWSDTPPALQVLDARFRVQGNSDRTYGVDEFLGGQPRRLLKDGDILTEVIVPKLPAGSGSAFIKHAKTAVDFALVNGAAWVALDGDVVTDVRISIGAIHTPPIRMTDAENTLRGHALSAEALARVAAAAAAQSAPRNDARASDDYLKHCAGVVARRCVERAAERAGSRAT